METLRSSIDTLLSLEKIKVWSLIVSLFGDLDSTSSKDLTGKQLNAILGHIGIKPEAIRVALHRLKNDNWIETAKTGRETLYQMSEQAVSQTTNVYGDVYGTGVKYPKGWCLQVTQENLDKNISSSETVSVQINKNTNLAPIINKKLVTDVINAELDRSSLPEWLSEKVISSKTLKVASILVKVVSSLSSIPDNTSQLDFMVLRLLILHHWRKMALRDNVWCHIWLYEDGDLALCHKIVTEFLANGVKVDASILD